MRRAGFISGQLSVGALIGAVAIVWIAYQAAYSAMLDQLRLTGQIRVEQAAERLVDQLDRYRVITNVLSQDPRVRSALKATDDASAVGAFLRNIVLTYGAERIELVDAWGSLIAASDTEHAQRLERSEMHAAAMNGRMGYEHRLEQDKRLFRFSRGVALSVAPPNGAIIVSADIASLEFEWSFVPEAIGFFDDQGVVFASNRPSLLLRQTRSAADDSTFPAFPRHRKIINGENEIWRLEEESELPHEVLVITRDVPLIGMTVRGFLDTKPARDAAWLRAFLAAAVLGVLALAIFIVALWRRRIADQLAMETELNAQLEARVDARTSELRTTQHQLIQASKMTALGQMSAGISHELNQPLAAIMNFAENGERFLERDRTGDARGNFRQISDQVQRIVRIIKNLRAFARNEDEPVEAVDLVAVLEQSLALVELAPSDARIAVQTDVPANPVPVIGGQVRLQQVIVNLLSNAIDAVSEVPDPRIAVTVETPPGRAVLSVRDNGPGIADPGRVFEPFYSTKELGASKGLGLGLSISYGIVGSFGGEITADNPSEGGALFKMELPLAEEAR